MARPVDEKIVKIKLDNQDFSNKAAETVGMFGKLQNAMGKIAGVNLGRTSSEIAGIGREVNGVPMGNFSLAVERVSSRLSVMGLMGVAAIQQIARKATDAGINMVKSLSLDGLKDGFREYELKMGSIQTIMSNTQGKNNLQQVTAVLGELNEYSDKTIYSFAEMTSNIGRFTAAGVGLEDSAMAIKGISNLAAVSGSNSQQAATGMYQLSQALSSGSVKLMDWNSVVNAGMGGKVFQDALTKTADGLGVARDKTVSFRDSLQDGWLTSEVLLKTLGQFSTDESMLEAATKVRTFTQLIATTKEAIGSGWSQTWELIIGDFNESGKLWSGIAGIMGKAVGDSAKARNDLIGGWVEAGGMEQVFRGLKNIVTGFGKVLGAVSEGFHAMFPKTSIGNLKNLSEAFVVFTDKFKFADTTITKLKTVSTGFFSILSSGWEIAKLLGDAIRKMIPSVDTSGLLDWIVGLAEMAIEFNTSIKEGNKLTEFISKLGDMFSKLSSKLEGINLSKLFGSFKIEGLDETSGLLDLLSLALKGLKNMLGKVATPIKEFFSNIGLEEVLGAGAIGGGFIFVKKISGMIDSITGIFTKADPGKMTEGIKGLFGSLGDSLESFINKTKYDSLLKIALALGILAISMKLLEGISWPDIGKGLLVMGLALTGLTVAFGAMSKMDMGGMGSMKIAITMIAMAVAISLIAVAVRKFQDTDTRQLAVGMVAVGGIILLLVASLKLLTNVMGKASSFSSVKIAITLIALSVAVAVLTSSVRKLSEIDADALARGMGATAIIVGILVTAFTALSLVKPPSLKSMLAFVTFTIGLQQAAIALIIFTAALHILIPAIEKLGLMDTGVLVQGLIGMSVALLAIGAAMTITKSSFMGAAGILVAVGALRLLLPVIQAFGAMPMEVIGKGIGTMAASLAILVLALNLAKGSMGGALAIVVAAGALNLLIVPLTVLGNMSITQLVTALVALGGALLIIGGLSMLLAPVIPAMLGLAASLFLIGLAVLVAGAGLTLFNAAILAFSALTVTAIASIITGFGMLISGIITLIPKIGQLITALVVTIAQVIIKSAPMIVLAAGVLIISFLEGITAFLPRILELGVAIILILIGGIVKFLPVLIAASVAVIIAFISGLSDAIRKHGPEMITEILGLIGEVLTVVVEALIAVLDAFIGWIPGVSASLGKASDAAAGAIRDRFDGETLGGELGTDFVDGVSGTAKNAKASGVKIGTEVENGVNTAELREPGKKKGIDFATGMGGTSIQSLMAAAGLGDNAEKGVGTTNLLDPGKVKGGDFSKALSGTGMQSMLAGVGLGDQAEAGTKTADLATPGKKAGSGFSDGVHSTKDRARTTGVELATSSKSGVGSVNTYDTGVQFGTGFTNGIHAMKNAAIRAAEEIASATSRALRNVLQVKSPSRETLAVGKFFGDGLINGIKAKTKGAGDAAAHMADKALKSMDKFITEFATDLIPEKENEYEFRLKPVLDLDGMGAYPDQKYGLTPDTSRANLQFGQVMSRYSQNGNKSSDSADLNKQDKSTIVNNAFDIHVTANGDLPTSTIKRMAMQIQTEIKNVNDRARMSRGEVVNY